MDKFVGKDVTEPSQTLKKQRENLKICLFINGLTRLKTSLLLLLLIFQDVETAKLLSLKLRKEHPNL